MEKLYRDYAYHLGLASDWYKRIGKHKQAEAYHKAHLGWANQVLADFKEKYR